MSLSDRHTASTYHSKSGNLPDLDARPKEEMFRTLMTKKAFEQGTTSGPLVVDMVVGLQHQKTSEEIRVPQKD